MKSLYLINDRVQDVKSILNFLVDNVLKEMSQMISYVTVSIVLKLLISSCLGNCFFDKIKDGVSTVSIFTIVTNVYLRVCSLCIYELTYL